MCTDPPRSAPVDPVRRHPLVHASLQTADAEIRYRRTGSGSPIVLLTSTAHDPEAAATLVSCLAEHFRVIAPEPPHVSDPSPGSGASRPALTAWLRDLIDGLGLIRPGIVADDVYALPALHFAMSDPERSSGVVALYRDSVDPGELPAPAAFAVNEGRLLLLRIALDSTPAGFVAAIGGAVRFLRRRAHV